MKAANLTNLRTCLVIGGNGRNDQVPSSVAPAFLEMDFIISAIPALGIYVPILDARQFSNNGAAHVEVFVMPESKRSNRPNIGRSTLANGGNPAPEPLSDLEVTDGFNVTLTSAPGILATQGTENLLAYPIIVPAGFFLRVFCNNVASNLLSLRFMYLPITNPCDDLSL